LGGRFLTDQMSRSRRVASGPEAIALFVLLVVRGGLLWLVIPIAFLSWLVISPMRLTLGKPYITAGKLIGWADLNLTAAIGQVFVRPFGQTSDFTPWSKVLTVEHRVSIIDPW
jgi:hypothetical protein